MEKLFNKVYYLIDSNTHTDTGEVAGISEATDAVIAECRDIAIAYSQYATDSFMRWASGDSDESPKSDKELFEAFLNQYYK